MAQKMQSCNLFSLSLKEPCIQDDAGLGLGAGSLQGSPRLQTHAPHISFYSREGKGSGTNRQRKAQKFRPA